MRLIGALLAVLFLSGCAGTYRTPTDPTQHMPSYAQVQPRQITGQTEFAIYELTRALANQQLDNAHRAELFYQRGLRYSSVGLKEFARTDFEQALRAKPDFAEAYHLVGIYAVQSEAFDEAYEAFDSALELNPEDAYGYLNRGIALYYGGRLNLADDDLLEAHQRDPNDPYRVLWLYLTEAKTDKQQAEQNLLARYQQADKREWGWQIVAHYLGNVDEAEFIRDLQAEVESQRHLAERLCEAYFYLAKQYQLTGKNEQAALYFKLALSSNVYEFIEHPFALLELERMNAL